MKNELEQFLEKIDCCFPYNDTARAKSLIDEAHAISDEAVFGVVHELARPGRGAKVDKSTLSSLLHYLMSSFNHPLKNTIFNLAESMIEKKEISKERAMAAMNEVRKFKLHYSALNIAYFSAYDCDEIEDLHLEIRNEWET